VIATEYKWLVLTVTTVGAFMAAVDENIVFVGLPSILHELHASLVEGVWVIAGYALSTTILLVAFGRVSDLFGKVKLYILGFAMFTVASALCGLSQTGSQLVFFRLVQGIGAALLLVNSVVLVADAFPSYELGTALGLNFMAWNVGAIAGYTLGGFIVQLLGWRFIFFVNIPIGAFGTLWAHERLKETRQAVSEKFDYLGTILYSSGLTLILVALTLEGSSLSLILTLLLVGILAFLIFVTVEKRIAQPALDLELFKIRLFSAGNVASFLNSLAYNSVPFIVTFYLQLVLHLNPLVTGLMFIPMEAVVLVVGPISGKLSDRHGARGLSSLGLLCNAAAIFWISTLHQSSSYSELILALAFFGVGRGLFASPNASSIMSKIPAESRGVGNGVRLTLVFTAIVISVPLCLVFMSLAIPYHVLTQIAQGTVTTISETTAFLTALRYALHISAVLVLLAIVPSLLRGQSNNRTGPAI
jgi:EmrB/QacA subfamily drug resistance transporter